MRSFLFLPLLFLLAAHHEARPTVRPAIIQTATVRDETPLEMRIFVAINKYRADRNLPNLELDPVLMEVARQRVGVFDHNHPRYGWVRDHAWREGFNGFASDNLAMGYATPEAAVGNAMSGWGDERQGHTVGHDMQMKGWSKINGHWVNQHFDRVGVAVDGRKYIAVFGTLDPKGF